MTGLEQRAAGGGSLKGIESVASFFATVAKFADLRR
jgi:hypothetical protein